MDVVGVIPTFTMGDRLRKAREGTGLTTRQFAAVLGVSQSTITNAENCHTRTRRITLLMWSRVTGVPVMWLETGEAPDNP
ncbi:helix-turn-helix transcriptional regulator [Nocardioides sp. JQ2195]|uniref:helix-turn-helix domain-containing protein n=1 Tax=Nocardioides sp. JQ2195 TaxID=2592334 RepID=UPI00143ED16B|nr:helix-turn-helix transcriptional regulator [Nocardioides sp. JQ2195]QIX28258.1 helix-turn-helix transcriptional regulator [Nocardioides sp. JQ2195]